MNVRGGGVRYLVDFCSLTRRLTFFASPSLFSIRSVYMHAVAQLRSHGIYASRRAHNGHRLTVDFQRRVSRPFIFIILTTTLRALHPSMLNKIY